MLKRFAAMLLITVRLAGSIALYYRQNGTRSGGVFHEASGIRPDAVVMRVNGDAVTAEEYLYWLDSVCEYLASYLGSIPDFESAVTETMTLVRKHKHIETLSSLDESIYNACSVTRMHIVIDITMNKKQMALKFRSNLRICADLVSECSIALLADLLLHTMVSLAPPAVIYTVVMVTCT